MKITSSAFADGKSIPPIYSCDGKETNPPLEFHDVPQNAKSLVLIMEDPDVPKTLREDGMWDHWILFNLPPDTKKIEEGQILNCNKGTTTSGGTSYVGPCPPDREHRYFFKLYALDTMLGLSDGVTKKQVQDAMQEHVIEECSLIGLYEKHGKLPNS